MAKEKKEKKEKGALKKEFMAFIARGNVLDLAVGVIIGGAFNAIVTALVNILMSVCTWWVPGGIKGLVTVLPAANNAQKGLNEAIGLGQKFQASELQALATQLAKANYANFDTLGDAAQVGAITEAKSTILSKYTLHATTYTYNLSAVIDWGAFINAIISFILIALTLFIIVKVANKMAKAREEMKAKAAAEAAKLLNKNNVEEAEEKPAE